MSDVGNNHENAIFEQALAILKRECVHKQAPAIQVEVYDAVQVLHRQVLYDSKRKQSFLGCVRTEAFEGGVGCDGGLNCLVCSPVKVVTPGIEPQAAALSSS